MKRAGSSSLGDFPWTSSASTASDVVEPEAIANLQSRKRSRLRRETYRCAARSPGAWHRDDCRSDGSGVDFAAADMPLANRFTIHILAAVAEYEARLISEGTKAAFAAAEARGCKFR
jgi:Resolvase, N terminal domain